MAVERVAAGCVSKPWGVADPRPWTQPSPDGAWIGELWYERIDRACVPPSLLLKLLFTSQPLSIQVHPDDAFAHSIGLPNGKTEAWFIIDAVPGARVALGLSRNCTPQQLRQSIEDGSIADLVVWRRVVAGDVISVPAGTIHSIGEGLVVAEIQQRSDTTYRLFDHGRQRDLHVDCAVAVARAGLAVAQQDPVRISNQRTLLASNPYFVLERVDLAPASAWRMDATQETWLLALRGSASIGHLVLSVGEAIFAESDCVEVRVGMAPVSCLVAYTGDVRPNLMLQCLARGQSDGVSASDRMPQVVHGTFNQPQPRQRDAEEERMKRLQRIAFIGNHLPRRCGIATFTHDLHRAVANARTDLDMCVVAMTEPGGIYDYPVAVRVQVRDETIDDYVQAAKFLNRSGFDIVSLQHEYGIFGGVAGGNIVDLVSHLEMPIVTTLHTVLPKPSPEQRRVMTKIIEHSSKLVVMSEKGRNFLRTSHGVPARDIDIIPHGIPDFPFLESGVSKKKLGFAGRTIILTFGLLSPSKGIETVIDAMPEIIRSCPDALYVVLGATHPNLLREQGEAYRDSLMARVRELGIDRHVTFLNQFVDQPTLLDFISMCDVYVTPYLKEEQMTSGTLAYSYGLGKAVVSTPYWHAKELLADGRGVLVPFGDSGAIGKEVSGLLVNDVHRHAMRKRAYAASRSMTWEQAAMAYVTTFESVLRPIVVGPIDPNDRSVPIVNGAALPEVRTDHLRSMCDSTGLLQHAVHGIPDRSHGYCVDDNARALLLASILGGVGEPRLPEMLTTRFAAFIQHAWNPGTRRFRNFMSYDRCWLEDHGSEDSHGRTLWALAVCAAMDNDPSRRAWSKSLFRTALPAVESFTSPRAWAFTLLALDAYCPLADHDAFATSLRGVLADRLMALLATKKLNSWVWFEDVLAYDNARLPQALIQTGMTTGAPSYTAAGLRSLRWLMSQQTAPSGHFRPVGSTSFGKRNAAPEKFDQQPVEAAATISACLVAARADRDSDWAQLSVGAFDWFLGQNDLKVSLVNRETGSCMDGLHPDRPNENRGAESVVSYLLGLTELRGHLRVGATSDSTRLPFSMALSA